MLEIVYWKNGVFKIHDTANYSNFAGSISRNGKRYTFLPEPFYAYDKEQLEEIVRKIAELELLATHVVEKHANTTEQS